MLKNKCVTTDEVIKEKEITFTVLTDLQKKLMYEVAKTTDRNHNSIKTICKEIDKYIKKIDKLNKLYDKLYKQELRLECTIKFETATV